MGNKRRRVALSCVDCRKRKVKCDRTYPSCIRCQKGGYGDKCTYVTHTSDLPQAGLPTPEEDELQRRNVRETSWAEEAAQWEDTSRNAAASQTRAPARRLRPGPLSPDTVSKTANLRLVNIQGRLMELETFVYSAGSRPVSHEQLFGIGNPVGPGYDRERNLMADQFVLSEAEKVVLRGKSFKTQYFGPSHCFSILLQFEELSKFVKDILVNMPSLTGAKMSMSKIRERAKKSDKATYDLAIENLISMIPERSFADRLLNQYLEIFETTYRVLHVPSFLAKYEAFWLNPKDASSDFIVQLLLAMATVYCVVPGGQEGFLGRSSVRRETASHWVNVCQHWLDQHSQKHVDLSFYQIHVMIWVARRMNCIKIKREWSSIGQILRMFMAAGLHREPSLLSNKISVCDSEMRRRLWYTVLELELQTTIDRGMLPTLSPLAWDTLPPRNIDDDSFDIDSDSLPESKPISQFTCTAFLALHSESLPMRIEALQKINSIRTTMEQDTVMLFDEKFRALLDESPAKHWKAQDLSHSSVTTPATATTTRTTEWTPRFLRTTSTSKVAAGLLELILAEYLLILHQPVATLTPPKHRHFFSRAARRDACMVCLDVYMDKLSETQRRALFNLRDDNTRAMLALSHDIVTLNGVFSHNSARLQDLSKPVDLLQKGVDLLEDRVANLGQGFHGYWITSSALSFVHSKQSPQVPNSTFAHAAVDRVVKLHDAVMQGQIPQARRLIPSDLQFNDTSSMGTSTRARRGRSTGGPTSNTGQSRASGTRDFGMEQNLGGVSRQQQPQQQQQQQQQQQDQSNTLQLQPGGVTSEIPTGSVAQGMEFIGFDQVDDSLLNGMLDGVEDFDWGNVWSFDPFSAMPLDNNGMNGNSNLNDSDMGGAGFV